MPGSGGVGAWHCGCHWLAWSCFRAELCWLQLRRLFHGHPHLHESLCKWNIPRCKARCWHGQEGIAPTGELCSACRSLWPELGTHSSPWAPGAPGTTRAQRWAQLNRSKSISCSQLPPAPWLAKLSWKPCNEFKRCLQVIFWQYLNRCREEMFSLAHMASANEPMVRKGG